jgi:hypothetical protein
VSTEVFISYRRSDREWAEVLERRLRERAVSAWYDGMLEPGANWRADIVENIKLARVLVILFSKAANASTELAKELSVADESQTLIVPVRVENVEPRGAYQYELTARNWFDAFDNPPAQLDEVAAKIAAALANPAELRRRLAKSAAELDRRRWHRLYGHRGLLANNTFLTLMFVLVSAVQFVAYESNVGAVQQMIAGRTPPLLAYGLAMLAVSVASPLLLFQALRQPLSGLGWLVPPAALVNTAVLVLLVRNLITLMSFSRTRRRI